MRRSRLWIWEVRQLIVLVLKMLGMIHVAPLLVAAAQDSLQKAECAQGPIDGTRQHESGSMELRGYGLVAIFDGNRLTRRKVEKSVEVGLRPNNSFSNHVENRRLEEPRSPAANATLRKNRSQWNLEQKIVD
ncbi:hypothetical protein BC567DRAFT_223396, partial [Phyllosticta citribraziliensis]